MSNTLPRSGWGFCIGFIGLVLLQGSAWAQHRDIFLASRADEQLTVIGEASVFNGSLGTPFLDEQDLLHHGTTNPGFSSINPLYLPDGYLPLPPESDLSFSLFSFSVNGLTQANAWYWDGIDQGADGNYLADIDFSPLDSGAAFRVYHGPVQMQLLTSGAADGSDSDQPGYVLAQTTQGGGLHVHPGYEVVGPAATPPDQGVYLVSLGLQMESLLNSDPLYFVLSTAEVDPAAGEAVRKWLNNAALGDEQLPGDFNFDGFVDAADYTLWRDGVGIDYATSDYEIWRANYGSTTTTVGSDGHQTTSVPEPSLLVMFMSLLLLSTAELPR